MAGREGRPGKIRGPQARRVQGGICALVAKREPGRSSIAFQRRERRLQGRGPRQRGNPLRSGTDFARPQAATTRPLQHGQYALSPWRTGPGCEPENGEMGSGSQRFPECAHTRPTGRRRQIQPGICKEEVGGPEKATGQAGPETAAAGPEPGQPGSTKARPAIRLIEATAEPATKAGFQTARPATAAAEPAGKCRQPGAETAGTGKAKQAASKREK